MNRNVWIRATLAYAILTATAAAGSHAQSTSLEVRGGGAMGSYEPASAKASWGQRPAIAAAVHYAATSMLSVYGGYSVASFGCRGGFCEDAEIHYYSRGWDAGAQLGGTQGLWLRGGGILHSFDVPASPVGSPRVRSGASLGLHAATGYGVRIHPRLIVSPSLRYTRYHAKFPDHPAGDRVDYLVADVGLSITF